MGSWLLPFRLTQLLPSLCDSLPEVLRADAIVQRQFLHFLHWSLSELAAAANQVQQDRPECKWFLEIKLRW